MIPDDVEKIIMTKEDYDRNVEQLLLEKLELQQRIDNVNNYIDDLLEKGIGKNILEAIKTMLGGKE